MKEGCGRQNGMKLSLLPSHASVCNTTMVVIESGDTWREDATHWSCTRYYGMGWYWISLSHSFSRHYLYLEKPALHLRGVGTKCPSLPLGLGHIHISKE
ncbi:hypothetical protein TNCV_2427811 [Trichonephila clavipes]|nr:hypothetical protein TNCV_2427811 [Trichonephila clavipes]